MPCLTTWAFFLRSGFAHVDNVISPCSKCSNNYMAPVNVAAPDVPNPASGPYTSTRNLPNLPRNSPEPSGSCLRNLHQHTPELSRTFRNLPPEPASATRTGTRRSLSGLKTPLAYAVGGIKQKQEKQKTKNKTKLWTQDPMLPTGPVFYCLFFCFLGFATLCLALPSSGS